MGKVAFAEPVEQMTDEVPVSLIPHFDVNLNISQMFWYNRSVTGRKRKQRAK